MVWEPAAKTLMSSRGPLSILACVGTWIFLRIYRFYLKSYSDYKLPKSFIPSFYGFWPWVCNALPHTFLLWTFTTSHTIHTKFAQTLHTTVIFCPTWSLVTWLICDVIWWTCQLMAYISIYSVTLHTCSIHVTCHMSQTFQLMAYISISSTTLHTCHKYVTSHQVLYCCVMWVMWCAMFV